MGVGKSSLFVWGRLGEVVWGFFAVESTRVALTNSFANMWLRVKAALYAKHSHHCCH